jgi:hypothetical protein
MTWPVYQTAKRSSAGASWSPTRRARHPTYMRPGDRCRLLFGPYHPPALRHGDRVVCLFRDCDVVVTSWSNGRIAWPRCRVPDTPGGGSGLLVDAELVRAICHESAAALAYWWGVGKETVWRWRRALGVGRMDSQGSRRLIRAAAEAAAARVRGKKLPPEAVERRRRTALAMSLGRNLQLGFHGRWWALEELALLGTMPDEDVAARIARTRDAVRIMRTRLGIPTARSSRRPVRLAPSRIGNLTCRARSRNVPRAF